MTNEKDKVLIEAAITKHWTNGERQRHVVNQELLSDLLTVCATVRKEEREAAFKEAKIAASKVDGIQRFGQYTVKLGDVMAALEIAGQKQKEAMNGR